MREFSWKENSELVLNKGGEPFRTRVHAEGSRQSSGPGETGHFLPLETLYYWHLSCIVASKIFSKITNDNDYSTQGCGFCGTVSSLSCQLKCYEFQSQLRTLNYLDRAANSMGIQSTMQNLGKGVGKTRRQHYSRSAQLVACCRSLYQELQSLPPQEYADELESGDLQKSAIMSLCRV